MKETIKNRLCTFYCVSFRCNGNRLDMGTNHANEDERQNEDVFIGSQERKTAQQKQHNTRLIDLSCNKCTRACKQSGIQCELRIGPRTMGFFFIRVNIVGVLGGGEAQYARWGDFHDKEMGMVFKIYSLIAIIDLMFLKHSRREESHNNS